MLAVPPGPTRTDSPARCLLTGTGVAEQPTRIPHLGRARPRQTGGSHPTVPASRQRTSGSHSGNSGSANSASSDSRPHLPAVPAGRDSRLGVTGPAGLPTADRRQSHRRRRPRAVAMPGPTRIARLGLPAARGRRRGRAADSDLAPLRLTAGRGASPSSHASQLGDGCQRPARAGGLPPAGEKNI